MKQAAPSTGELCGGSFVDAAFLAFIAKLASQPQPWRDANAPTFEQWRAQNPRNFNRMMSAWEAVKRNFKGTEDYVTLEIVPSLKNILLPPDLREEDFYISKEDMESFFERCIKDICYLIELQLEENPDILDIFSVGGFASSDYLTAKLKAAFNNGKRQVFTVDRAAEAVYLGAVLIAADPEAMQDRIMHKTIGFSMADDALPTDPPELVVTHNGDRLTQNVFDALVTRGTLASVSTPVTRRYHISEVGSGLILTLYECAEKTTPRFVTDDKVRRIHTLEVRSSACPRFGVKGLEV